MQNKIAKKTPLLAMATMLPILSLLPLTIVTPAMAEPTVIVNNTPDNAANSTTENTDNHTNNVGGGNLDNGTDFSNTLASQLQPTQDQLSEANQQLLSRNAQLQRDVNDLETQVNVLVNERSGHLFMYGAMTVIAGILVGIFIGWLVFAYRERW